MFGGWIPSPRLLEDPAPRALRALRLPEAFRPTPGWRLFTDLSHTDGVIDPQGDQVV